MSQRKSPPKINLEVPTDQAVIAWRVWNLSGASNLVSPFCMTWGRWLRGRPCVAMCPSGHFAPRKDCNCGIYAVGHEFDTRLETTYLHVLGRVSLWGKIVLHDRGYRAQYAYPYDLEVRVGKLFSPIARDREEHAKKYAKAIREKYCVDVSYLSA